MKKRKPPINGVHKPPALDCCPTCGHPIIPDDGLNLTRIQQRIMGLFERHGQMDSECLRSAIWGSDPNGGPISDVVKMHICLLNKRIRHLGIAIRKRGGRYNTPYRLVQV